MCEQDIRHAASTAQIGRRIAGPGKQSLAEGGERAEKKPYGRPGEGGKRRSAARGIAPFMKGKGIGGGLVSVRWKHRLHRLQADAELDLFCGEQAKNGAPTSTGSMQGSSGLRKTTTPIRSERVGDAVSTGGMQERFRAWSGQAGKEKREVRCRAWRRRAVACADLRGCTYAMSRGNGDRSAA